MLKRIVSEVMLTLLFIGTLTLTFNIQPVKSTWTGTVYIRADGSIDPPDAPITTYDNITYILTDNITSSGNGIVVEKDNIIINGAYFVMQGNYAGEGIRLVNRDNLTVINLEVRKFNRGIFIQNSSNICIKWNSVRTNAVGVYAEYSSNIRIYDNDVTCNGHGIYLLNSFENNIADNKISSNLLGAIVLYASSFNKLYRNSIMNNSQSVLYNPSIWLKKSSSFNNINNNNITQNNSYGILFEVNCSFNNICRNHITSNLKVGIKLESSSYNTISENIVANNSDGIYIMSWLWPNVPSCHNLISKNIITANEYGIYVTSYNSFNNTITENTLTSNNYSGLCLEHASNNKIFHNNFVNNVRQVFSCDSVNIWDDGYPCGGNYWSDYNGTDLFSGSYQNETGSDGIGDTPYVIDENNQDNYPSMGPFSSFNVAWNGRSYPVDFVSNSTISNLTFDGIEGTLSFNVSGPDGTLGICRVTVPKSLMEPSQSEKWQITIDGSPPLSTNTIENENYTYLYFAYEHSIHKVEIRIISEKVRTLLGVGWGWMRIAPKQYVYGRAELCKIGDMQIELVITYQGEEYSRIWNVIYHREYRYSERYLCYSKEWGFLIVGLHKRGRWQFWYAVGKGEIAFGFIVDPPCGCGGGGRHLLLK